MRRVVFNQKGGVGKSSITCNLAAIHAARGKTTLVIDLDPQGNSSQYLLGKDAQTLTPSIADFFEQCLTFTLRPKTIDEFAHATQFPNLFVIPANYQLDELTSKLESRYKMFKLREALLELDEFDAIYIDTPPALNFYTRSALIAAESCLIPFDCDDFSKQALFNLLANVQEIQSDHNDELEVEGIIVNQFQPRANLPTALIEELKAESLPVIAPYLPSSVKMRESHHLAKPLIHSAPKHKLTQTFIELFEVLNPALGQETNIDELALEESI